MITRSREYVVNGVPTQKVIYSAVSEFLLQPQYSPRLKKLGDYYGGDGRLTNLYPPILSRTRTSGLPNNKLAHNYPRFIATMSSGYLIGDPVSYADAKQEAALQAVTDAYRAVRIDTVDAELAKNAATYGKAVELVYSDDGANPRTVALPPITSFVVYDNTADLRPLFGVYFFAVIDEDGGPDGFTVFVYSDRYTMEYKVVDLETGLEGATPISIRPHYFGGVPLNEYWNNEDETGDFESVIPLIDAYNVLQSDRVNDKEQFVNALLVLVGCNVEEDAQGRSPWQQLREDGGISIPGEGASIQYLFKALTESDVEVLKQSLTTDIHKLSMVPDLTDQNFASNASGVAMKYKLIGFEQLTKIKERWFREGLYDRLKLFANFLALKGAPKLDTGTVTITFKRGLPANELEQAQIVQTQAGANAASTYQRVKTLHPDWTTDEVDAEVDRISKDGETAANQSVATWARDYAQDTNKTESAPNDVQQTDNTQNAGANQQEGK